MSFINKSVLLEYSAEQMFALVDGIESYPEFLEWCSEVDVRRDDRNEEVIAGLTINFHGIRKTFTTKNINLGTELITMTLISGPFTRLEGSWKFKALRADACKVEFTLEYDLTGHLLEVLIDQVFGAIANTMIDSFCKRAKVVYGC